MDILSPRVKIPILTNSQPVRQKSDGSTIETFNQGTWQTYIPILQAVSGNPTVTYSGRLGKYLDDGKIRHFSIAFDTTGLSLTNAADEVRISLPSVSANRAGDRTRVDANVVTVVGSNIVSFFGLVLPNTSYVQLQGLAASPLTYSAFSVGMLLGSIRWFVSGFYELP